MAQPDLTQKIGLALCGGAVLGAAHVGILRAFEEKGLRIHCLTGTSIGAGEGLHATGLPGRAVDGSGEPAVAIDRAIAKHFEVLRGVTFGGLLIVEGIKQARAFHWHLGRAVHHLWLGQEGGLQNGRCNVDHMTELRAHPAAFFDALGPVGDHPIARAAEIGSDLLGPLEG